MQRQGIFLRLIKLGSLCLTDGFTFPPKDVVKHLLIFFSALSYKMKALLCPTLGSEIPNTKLMYYSITILFVYRLKLGRLS